jgi:hypothetical protein
MPCRLKTYAREVGCVALNPRKRALTADQQALYGAALENEGTDAAAAAPEAVLVLTAPLKFPKAPAGRAKK